MFSEFNALNSILGVANTELTLFHILMRAVVGYIFGIIVILLNKRFIIERSSFDVIVKLMIGTSLAGAIVGVSPFFETLIMISFLVFLNWVLSVLSYHFLFFDNLLSGQSAILVKDNKINWQLMRKNFITKDDLIRALRRAGLKKLEQVDTIYIERHGEISVIPK